MSSSEAFTTTLKNQGHSVTKPRLTIFEAMQNTEPLTMNDLVKRTHTKIDRASVYRTIELLERLGVIRKIQIGWKYKLELSDQFSHHHHHASCSRCQAVIVLEENPSIERLIHKMAKTYNFRIQDHQLEITGLCESCQQPI